MTGKCERETNGFLRSLIGVFVGAVISFVAVSISNTIGHHDASRLDLLLEFSDSGIELDRAIFDVSSADTLEEFDKRKSALIRSYQGHYARGLVLETFYHDSVVGPYMVQLAEMRVKLDGVIFDRRLELVSEIPEIFEARDDVLKVLSSELRCVGDGVGYRFFCY